MFLVNRFLLDFVRKSVENIDVRLKKCIANAGANYIYWGHIFHKLNGIYICM